MRNIKKVVLISNYRLDCQFSMLLFAELLFREITEVGIKSEIIYPAEILGKLAFGKRFLIKWLGYIDKYLLFPILLKIKLRKINAETNGQFIVHVADHSNSIYYDSIKNYAHLITCHDLMAIKSALGQIPQNKTKTLGKKLQNWILSNLIKYKYTVCVSNNTRNDLLKYSTSESNQIRVIFSSLNFKYRRLDYDVAKTNLLNRTDLKTPFILHIGSNNWYKNRIGVVEIFSKVLDQLEDKQLFLVLCGESISGNINDLIKQKKLESNIIILENSSNTELQSLYSLAEVFLFPSIYEGFGWPPLEAQACGCPVVSSNGGSLKEIIEDSALVSHPDDLDLFARNIVSLIQSKTLRESCIEKGYNNLNRFSTEKMVRGYVDLYNKILNN